MLYADPWSEIQPQALRVRTGLSCATAVSVQLLDGGEQAYPRMLEAIAKARTSVHLEVFAFAPSGIGARFVLALLLRR